MSIRAHAGRLRELTNLADLGSQLDVLLRTALDLLLGRHIDDCELVFDWQIRGGGRSCSRTFGRQLSLACAAQRCAGAGASVHDLKFSFQLRSCKPRPSSRPLQWADSSTTITQRGVPHSHNGEQQERRVDWHGRHGQDVLAAVEYGGMEVSSACDSATSLSFAIGKSSFVPPSSLFMMTVSAFGSSMAHVQAGAVLVTSTWTCCCP
jgi:hypothetical protein